MNRRRWLWITFSILLTLLLGTLATTYNVTIVQDYRQMLEYARSTPLFHLSAPAPPRWNVALGTLGFVTALAGVVLFLLKILKEMKLNQLQSEFIAHVSHELKTPIATLELTSGLLRDDEGSLLPSDASIRSERERLWQSHQEELARLKRQVEELLEAARLQAAPTNDQAVSLHLGHWIEDACPRWRSLLGPGGRIELSGDALDFEVLADEKKMSLIFENLMDNARKFAIDAARVIIQTEHEGRNWRIRVRDEGRGFPPEQSRRIFARFHRAPTNAPYAIPGSGLGLFLSNTAARSMGWQLQAESAGIGKGAEFTLSGKVVGT